MPTGSAPADGRLASTSQEKLKLSRWAEAWEKQHGKIWCEERVSNNVERDQHRAVPAQSEQPRPAFEARRQATAGMNDNRPAVVAAAKLAADQQRKAAELVSVGRAMHERYRQELADLGAALGAEISPIRRIELRR